MTRRDCVFFLTAAAAMRPAAAAGIDDLRQRIREVAALPGEPSRLEAAGVSRKDLPLLTLEPVEPITSPRRRCLLIGGLDGDERGVAALLDAVRWFKSAAPAAVRQQWSLAALPCGNPEGWVQFKPTNDSFGKPGVEHPPRGGFFDDRKTPEARYLWRWIAWLGADLVVQIDGGNRLRWRVPPASAALGRPLQAGELVSPDSLAMALSTGTPGELGTVPALVAEARANQGGELLGAALRAAASLGRSPLRQALVRRIGREPLQVASLLAERYPAEPAIAYIPAVAWTSALRLGALRGDPAQEEKVRRALEPWLSGGRPLWEGGADVARLGGLMVFAELARQGDPAVRDAAARIAREGCARFGPPTRDRPLAVGRFWTDDMFMSAAPLGRTASAAGEPMLREWMAGALAAYVARLQRPDGLFVHAPEAPHAWGRGNGFAALGLAEGLAALPEEHPGRAGLLAAFRRQVQAALPHQTPEGSWRQVVDFPGSYRELTVTAMLLVAAARGIAAGWLDASLRPAVRRAWEAVSARVGDDGRLADVCTGTGAGPSLRYYLDRPAVYGPDERGGAMALAAAVEMAALR